MATRTISDAGGNWNATAAWVEGVVPVAGDDIVATGTSGNLAVNTTTAGLKSFDLTNYVGILSGANILILTGASGSTVACLFSTGMTLTYTGELRLSPIATCTINLTTNGKLHSKISSQGSATGYVVLQDNLSFSAVQTNTLQAHSPFDLNGKTVSGNSTINRLLISSATIGTQKTITVNGGTFANCDFMDIALSPATDLSAITGGSGDCGGNSDITFTTAQDQAFNNANGGNFSTATNWTGRSGNNRIPLPQDTAFLGGMDGGGFAYATTKTITVDMPRFGSIDCTGITYTGTKPYITWSGIPTIYGSLTFTTNCTSPTNKSLVFAGRSNSSLTSAGHQWGGGASTIKKPGATLTLMDAFTSSNNIELTNGTLTTDYAVTLYNYLNSSGTTTNMGTGTWTLTGAFNIIVASGTLNASNCTIALTSTSSSAGTFSGGTTTFKDIIITPGSGVLTFSGAFTFANMRMSTDGAKTIKFTSGTTYTMTGSDFFTGNSTAPSLSTIVSGDTLNGNFETLGAGGADVFGSWTETYNGTSTITVETTDVHSGSRCLRLTMDGSASNTWLSQDILTTGRAYKVEYWAKNVSGTYAIQIGDTGSGSVKIQRLTTTWTKYTVYFVCTSSVFMIRRGALEGSAVFLIDDIVVTPITGLLITPTTNQSIFTINKTTGTIVTDNIYLQDCTVSGGLTAAYAGSHSIDGSGNTGWTFTDPITGIIYLLKNPLINNNILVGNNPLFS